MYNSWPGRSDVTSVTTRIRETLDEEFGQELAADFDAALAALETVSDDTVTEVELSLLVGAHHQVLLYDIGKWGEDIWLASKATYSRTQSELEDAGLIDTEKVPIEVGRPRLRLVLKEEQLQERDDAALQQIAEVLLEERQKHAPRT